MKKSLQEQVVLITGSSRGIGAALAEGFAQEGAVVILNYMRSKERADQLATRLSDQYGVEVLALQADVTDEGAVERMIKDIIEEFGALDVVVNNALHGYTFDPDQRKMAWEMEWEDYQHQLDGSLKGAYHVCKYAMPHMKANVYGRIVNIVSNLVYDPVVPYHDYNTAKGAVLTYSQNLAQDLGSFGINVNCVAPGLVYPTDASRHTKEEVREALSAQTPLKRMARPEDVVGSVLFFASGWSNFVTGQCLVVDGGLA